MADTGFGTSVAWTTNTQMDALELLDLSVPGVTREMYETTHYGTTAGATGKIGNATYIPGDIIDGGTVQLTYHLDIAVELPTYDAADTVTITWPNADTWAFSAAVQNTSFSNPMKGVQTVTLDVKVLGEITFTNTP